MKKLFFLFYILAALTASIVSYKLPAGSCNSRGESCQSFAELFYGASSIAFFTIGFTLLIQSLIKEYGK